MTNTTIKIIFTIILCSLALNSLRISINNRVIDKRIDEIEFRLFKLESTMFVRLHDTPKINEIFPEIDYETCSDKSGSDFYGDSLRIMWIEEVLHRKLGETSPYYDKNVATEYLDYQCLTHSDCTPCLIRSKIVTSTIKLNNINIYEK